MLIDFNELASLNAPFGARCFLTKLCTYNIELTRGKS